MTRLTTTDISDISSSLALHEKELVELTGKGLLGIACHGYGLSESALKKQISGKRILVIPVTTGEGVISGFSASVAAILDFIGFEATVSETPDVGGLAEAFQNEACGVIMADDDCYAAFHLASRRVETNDVATGKVFAAALDLMAADERPKQALILGCGPVGRSGAETLLDFGFDIALYDVNQEAALALQQQLRKSGGSPKMQVVTDLHEALVTTHYIFEATPVVHSIPISYLTAEKRIAAPGVPLFAGDVPLEAISSRVVHDKLELGTVAMAVGMLVQPKG